MLDTAELRAYAESLLSCYLATFKVLTAPEAMAQLTLTLLSILVI
jgi:hypothetical protein